MKKFLLFIALALCSFSFSQESKNTDWEFYTTTDFAYYLKSAYIPGRDHFSPVSGPYDGIGFRSSFSADYTKEIPLGTHPLLSNSKIIFTPGIELSPITFSLKLSTTFEPVPFYQFSAGGTLGTGWNFSTLSGLKLYNFNTNEYENPNLIQIVEEQVSEFILESELDINETGLEYIRNVLNKDPIV